MALESICTIRKHSYVYVVCLYKTFRHFINIIMRHECLDYIEPNLEMYIEAMRYLIRRY